jgi:hypothetical protein
MRLLLLLLLCNYIVNYGVHAQYCGIATTNVVITPSTTVQYSATYSSGRRAFTFNAVAGNEYTFSTVGETTVDTYLRLYSTSTGGSLLSESDDYFNTQSEITWYCSVSGTYSILLSRWSSTNTCNTLNANARIKYQSGGTSGSTIVSIGNGEGTVYQVPVNHYFKFGWSEMIFLKSEINTSGNITKIRFQCDPTSPSAYVAENQKIYMGHTTLSTLPNVIVKEDAQLNYVSSNYTLVYNGTITWTTGWVEIVLQTPFPWNNTDNLIIKYENREGTFSSFYPIFYYTSKTATVGYKYQDASYPTSDGTRDGFRPNIKIALSDVSLPVELVSFNGSNEGNYNVLKWVTASEYNNDYFLLEKSHDGNVWNYLDKVDAIGISSEINTYVYSDVRVSAYYRLYQYDFDGSSKYLGIVALIDNETKYILKVYDLTGREVGLDYKGVVILIYSDGSIVKKIW